MRCCRIATAAAATLYSEPAGSRRTDNFSLCHDVVLTHSLTPSYSRSVTPQTKSQLTILITKQSLSSCNGFPRPLSLPPQEVTLNRSFIFFTSSKGNRQSRSCGFTDRPRSP